MRRVLGALVLLGLFLGLVGLVLHGPGHGHGHGHRLCCACVAVYVYVRGGLDHRGRWNADAIAYVDVHYCRCCGGFLVLGTWTWTAIWICVCDGDGVLSCVFRGRSWSVAFAFLPRGTFQSLLGSFCWWFSGVFRGVEGCVFDVRLEIPKSGMTFSARKKVGSFFHRQLSPRKSRSTKSSFILLPLLLLLLLLQYCLLSDIKLVHHGVSSLRGLRRNGR